MNVWFDGEIDRITTSHYDFGKNYILKLYKITVPPNSLLIQT